MTFILGLIYILICIPFGFIGKGHCGFFFAWIICIGLTPILGVPLNLLFDKYCD